VLSKFFNKLTHVALPGRIIVAYFRALALQQSLVLWKLVVAILIYEYLLENVTNGRQL